MLRGQHISRTFGAGPVMGFSAKKRSRNSDLGAAGQLGPRSHSQKKSVLQSSHGRTGIFVTLVPPMSRKRGWASPFWASPYSLGEPSNEVGASHQTRLGEPSNEVGRASTKPLGEPLNHSGIHACFKAAPWRSYGASSARARSAHLVPARHGACSAHLVPARHCTPSTVPARHRGANFPTSARSALGCLLGTCPLGTFSY